jgi:hypothetical protein
MKKLLLSSYLIFLGLGSFAQAFVIDSSFQPFFDIRNSGSASITDLHEVNSNNVILVGRFDFYQPAGTHHDGITNIIRNGNRKTSFQPNQALGNPTLISEYINSKLVITGSNIDKIQIDTNGLIQDWAWSVNSRKTVQCFTGIPYFFPDGSSLFGNGNIGGPCPIINSPDTFPGKHLIKVDPNGLWDSIFTGIANREPNRIVQYDSNRLFIIGFPTDLTHYNGMPINGMCRIFMDGTLDTTFTSPVLDPPNAPVKSDIRVSEIQADGSFFMHGGFWLPGQTDLKHLVKVKADGRIDSSFNNFNGAVDSTYGYLFVVINSIVKADDGGYVVGGGFNKYQGFIKNDLVKLDSLGNVEPQYFTSIGPDSSAANGSLFSYVYGVEKSKFGGYYVFGDFLKWDGQPSQPIVRITGLGGTVGVGEIGLRAEPRSDILVYPNPSNGIFTIESEVGINKVEVYSLDGKLHPEFFFVHFDTNSASPNPLSVQKKSNEGRNFQLDLTNSPKGIYFLKVELKNGTVVTKKIVKH